MDELKKNSELLGKINKIDDDVDAYMEKFEKKPYTDGWPEDKWEEEMNKHPFFMKEFPNSYEELPPLVQGLQQLKYDDNENSPEELANTYKEEGNLNFKVKKYRQAIINYEEGLKQNCSDSLKGTLYNNCGAAHYYLKNYRSALECSRKALEKTPTYKKAERRIGQCLFHLEKYTDCITQCDKMLETNFEQVDVIKLKKDAMIKQKHIEKEKRRKEHLDAAIKEEDKKLIEAIRKRNIKVAPKGELKTKAQLAPKNSANPRKWVHLEYDGSLIWPVSFLYPEYGTMDTIELFSENDTFYDHINNMFAEPCDWDTAKKYKPDNISVYFTDINEKALPVPIKSTLLDVMKKSNFMVHGGCPFFFLFITGSEQEAKFRKNPSTDFPLSFSTECCSGNEDDGNDNDVADFNSSG